MAKTWQHLLVHNLWLDNILRPAWPMIIMQGAAVQYIFDLLIYVKVPATSQLWWPTPSQNSSAMSFFYPLMVLISNERYWWQDYKKYKFEQIQLVLHMGLFFVTRTPFDKKMKSRVNFEALVVLGATPKLNTFEQRP